MPEGILFDHAGNMTRIEIEHDSVLSELYEHIGCRIVIPVYVAPGLNLWVDAEGDSNGQKLNTSLSNTAHNLGALDYPLYGPGVFLGCERPGEGEPVLDLTRDQTEAIVIAQVRSALTELRDPIALNR